MLTDCYVEEDFDERGDENICPRADLEIIKRPGGIAPHILELDTKRR